MKINITYDVVTSFVLTVDRDELPATHNDLLESVTRDELAECEMIIKDIEWDQIKDAWRSSNPDNATVCNEEGDEIDFAE